MSAMKLFYLNRIVDESGVSGTGIVARGLVFPSGKCVLEWQTEHSSVAVYDSLDAVRAIHGHNFMTEVVVLDALASLQTLKDIGLNRVMDDFYSFSMMSVADRAAEFFGFGLAHGWNHDFALVDECATCGRKRRDSASLKEKPVNKAAKHKRRTK